MSGALSQYRNSRNKSSAVSKVPYLAVDARFSVATSLPTKSQRWSAIAIAAFLAVIFISLVPFASTEVPRLDGLNAIVEALVFGSYLVTAVLLFSQCSVIYSPALFALANGYLFSAVIVIAHALAYPGIFSPTGVLGSRTDTEAWLFVFWHFGFSASVLCYAWLKNDKSARDLILPSAIVSFSWSFVISVSVVCAFTWGITAGGKVIPPLIAGEAGLTGFTHVVAGFDLLTSVIALLILWSRRRSTLDLWLMIAVWARILALVTPALLVSSRYALGVYGLRLYLIVSALAVPIALLWQTGSLYAQVIRSNMMLLHERNNKLLKIEAMAASIAHELKQPMAAIAINGSAALRFLGREKPDLEEVREAVARMVGDSHRLDDILTQIRRLFSRADVKMQLVDLNNVVRQVLRLLGGELARHKISARVDFQTETPRVFGNDTQLEEVLINVIQNAIQAMEMITDRGRILRISTELRDHQTVVLSVADTGPGIDSNKMSSIFDPFITSKQNGTGLGLALSRMIIEGHNGEISVSNSDRGAKFDITLPTERANRPRAEVFEATKLQSDLNSI
jgi:signal transduction histidine kinase